MIRLTNYCPLCAEPLDKAERCALCHLSWAKGPDRVAAPRPVSLQSRAWDGAWPAEAKKTDTPTDTPPASAA